MWIQVNSTPVRGEVNSIQRYILMFYTWFTDVRWFLPSIPVSVKSSLELMLYCFIMCRIKIKFSYSYSYSLKKCWMVFKQSIPVSYRKFAWFFTAYSGFPTIKTSRHNVPELLISSCQRLINFFLWFFYVRFS